MILYIAFLQVSKTDMGFSVKQTEGESIGHNMVERIFKKQNVLINDECYLVISDVYTRRTQNCSHRESYDSGANYCHPK